jgi:hypothetical protein
MVGFRDKGVAHLKEAKCQVRLSKASQEQRDEIIQRLVYCRMTYPGRDPGISDELFIKLKDIFYA